MPNILQSIRRPSFREFLSFMMMVSLGVAIPAAMSTTVLIGSFWWNGTSATPLEILFILGFWTIAVTGGIYAIYRYFGVSVTFIRTTSTEGRTTVQLGFE